jgi:hypothetical protein
MDNDTDRETDDQLIKRWTTVKLALADAEKRLSMTMRPESRMRKARWCGSLRFTLLGIEREMKERGLGVS